MTNSPKSMEYYYGLVTFIAFIAAIVSRQEMNVSDKIMTLALISAVPWAVSFLSRKEAEKRAADQAAQERRELQKQEKVQ